MKDGLITIGAIWLALFVAGLAVSGLEISLVATLLSFGSDAAALSEADFIIVAVPTPVDEADRKSTRLNSSHKSQSRMPSSA